MSLNEELGLNGLARAQENVSNGLKLGAAAVGVVLMAKGWDGASNPLNPLFAAAGGLLATPAIVTGILKEVADNTVQLTKNFSTSAGRLAMGASAAVSLSVVPITSYAITDQREMHDARKAACNGATEGVARGTRNGEEFTVDCKTMMTPVLLQNPPRMGV